MKTRQLKYSSATTINLSKNQQHQFAKRHALRIYNSNSIYSFIPKNACSTLRVSLAIANGCIGNADKAFNWIHDNNGTFKADLASLALADYTFVILRCPYARLASAYLDKIAELTTEAWALHDAMQRKLMPDAVTFRLFIKAMTQSELLRANIHWQPQVDFLVYKEYDDYFSLENFSAAKEVIEKKAQIKIVDARPLTKHGIDRFVHLTDRHYADALPAEIRALKATGKVPDPASLYDDELIAIVKKLFKKDIDLYKNLFGTKPLMFS
ncbi:MAG: sulfotransferase family 2 domain-containing protein [Methylovulum sp.]|nr:sulfotransferase family 2 domain-containing protein [Methylovulum sp.]